MEKSNNSERQSHRTSEWILEWATMNGLLKYQEPWNKDKAYKKAVKIFNLYFNYTIV